MSEKFPWLPELKKWEKAEYDGIKGSPPEWVPKPYRDKFLSARGALFHTMQRNTDVYQEIKSRFDKQVAEKYYRLVQALTNEKSVYDESLFILVDLYKTVLLGEGKGLAILVGRRAAKGSKFSTGGTSKKGKEYEPKASIRKICEEIDSYKFNDVLDALRNTDLCNFWHERLTDPIETLFTDVIDTNEIIIFKGRGEHDNDVEEISFGRLRNILTEI